MNNIIDMFQAVYTLTLSSVVLNSMRLALLLPAFLDEKTEPQLA